jgi:two-component system phosphate regulon sensor histidine kinase PhoR
MKRSGINTIIILMGSALLGLVVLQALWVRQSVHNKEYEFDRLMYDILEEVSTELERRDAAQHLQLAFGNDPIVNKPPDKGDPGLVFIPEDYDPNTPLSVEVRDSLGTDGKHVRQVWINDSIVEVEIIEMDSLSSLEGSPVIVHEQFLDQYGQIVQDVTQRAIFSQKTLSERVEKETLQKLFEQAIQSKGIDTDYSFVLIDQSSNEIVLKSDNYLIQESAFGQIYSTRLFPDAFMNFAGRLDLFLPDKRSYLFGQLWPMLTASVLFLVLIVTGFILTIRIIFRQKKLSDLKTEFINNMTHELKTPVATIGLITEMLSDEKVQGDQPKVKQYASLISDENERLSSHIEKVLQAARLERGDLSINPEEVNLHEIVEQVKEKVGIRVEREMGELFENLEASNPVVMGDSVHILNVIYNLVDNAIKYKKDVPRIHIHTWNSQGGIYLSLKDQGIGMNKNAQSKIFEQFYRVPTGNIHDVKGFGLGLNYVKSMMDLHKGRVTVDSTPGVGSTFTLFFPQNESEQ